MRRSERLVILVLSLLFAPVSFVALPILSPVLLFGVAVLGLLSIVGTVFALRAARVELEMIGD
jgi:hypothetical protein